MSLAVWHFGGNGHCEARLEPARGALGNRPDAPRLVDVPYPGFEDRPTPGSLDGFLDGVGDFCRDEAARTGTPAAAYASGIGALVVLGLRARGELADVQAIFQGPVLWGLAERAFPKVMRRFPPARGLLQRAFGLRAFQDHFVGKHFRRPLTGPIRAAFFEGYARCPAFGDCFDWFTPDWLATLQADFRGRPEALAGVTVWIGGEDRVVGRREVDLTREALGVDWPIVEFPGWGHYPMIDEPEEWAEALCHALAPA